MIWRLFLPYIGITYGLAWGALGLLLVYPESTQRWFGELNASNPLFILAVYSPAIAALVLVPRHWGVSGLRAFLSRLLLWRVEKVWYWFIGLVVPGLFYAGAWLKGIATSEYFPDQSWTHIVSAMAFMLVLGPVEEIGWRGFALPVLQRAMAPLWAGLLLGAIWGVWHLPAFFLSGVPQSDWTFVPFLAGSVAIGVIVTPMFNQSRGSILLPLLLHWQLNNPVFPDAAPHDTLFFVGAAIVVVMLNWDDLLDRRMGVTDVVPNQVPLHSSRSAAI